MGKRDYEALAIILIICVSMILGNTALPVLLGPSGHMYVIRPMFWFALSFYVWKQPRARFKGKLKLYRFVLIWSAICGILYISAFFLGGFIDGIGKSPYDNSIKGIFLNLVCFGSVVVMMEWVRNYIINRVREKYIIPYSIITVTVFTMYKLNLRIALSVSTWQQLVQYIGEYAMPEIMANIFLTYLVYTAGAYPAVIYSAVISFPKWIVPVLPDLKWISKAFLGVIMPVAFLLLIHRAYKKQAREIRLRDQKRENPYSWIAISIFSILLIWFVAGVFPVFPAVVVTGSMQPVIYPGDVAIIQKSDGENIMVGDVIQYWTGSIFIIHRVVEIDAATGKFRTKGDNNSAPDNVLVSKEQVRGKMVAVIPRIGKLSLWMKTKNQIPNEQVEF